MDDLKLKIVIGLAGIICFFALLGIVGNIDYTERVILQMSHEEYDSIRKHLTEEGNGRVPADGDIVRWWDKHHE